MEETLAEGYVAVCLRTDVGNGQHRRYVVHGKDILLVGTGDRVFALANRCPHMAKPLEGGRVSGMTYTCPFHGAQFDLETGRSLGFPKTRPVTRFEVRIHDERIWLRLDQHSAG